MSYILDALRKSESERRQEQLPDLAGPSPLIHTRRRRHFPGLGWLAIALVLNAAVLAAVFWPRTQPVDGQAVNAPKPETPVASQQAAPPAKETETPQRSRPAPNAVPPAKDPVAEGVGAGLAPGSVVVADQPLRIDPAPERAAPEPGRPPAATAEKGPAAGPAPEEPLEVELSVPALGEMPLAFQRQMPDLVFNSHIYSANPASRRVMINNNYLREGDRFSGLQVEEITDQGVILSRNGRAFHVGVVNDWMAPR